MKVTKQQKVLLGILVLGGAVLGNDLVSGNAPVTPVAQAALMDTPHLTVVPQQATTVPPAIDGQLVSRRLAALSKTFENTADLPDAFGGSNEVAVQVPRRESFARDYHLNGVLRSGNAGSAVVNGQVIRQGQVVGGYKLVSVTGRTATFESGNERLTLALNE